MVDHAFSVEGERPSCVVRHARGYSGAEAAAVLARAIGARAFPGAAFAVLHHEEIALQGAAGRFTYDPASEDVTLTTVFDLASVTKVVATTAIAMVLVRDRKLSIDVPVVELVPEFGGEDARRSQVTVRMLLAHSSGLPDHVKLHLQGSGKQEILRLAYSVPLKYDPGTHAEYSDVGFIVLGELLERVMGETLDVSCAREIFTPLNMKSAAFVPTESQRAHVPPTVDDRYYRHRIIQGEVNDENASAMGGVAGHAGLFSNAQDLMVFADAMLGGRSELFPPELIELFTRKQACPPGTSRALGWDTPSSPSQSGTHFSTYSFGHLGYTGTSLWIDAEREIAIALLTNRTWPDNQSQLIKQVRPEFHDAVMRELLAH